MSQRAIKECLKFTTNQDLAKRLGVCTATVSHWNNGKTKVLKKYWPKIKKVRKELGKNVTASKAHAGPLKKTTPMDSVINIVELQNKRIGTIGEHLIKLNRFSIGNGVVIVFILVYMTLLRLGLI